MWNQIQKSIGKLPCPEADSLHRQSIQVETETVHGEKLALQWVGCDACVENKGCMCDHSNQDLKSVVNEADVEDHTEANSSFAHSVINMIGMLIGKTFKFLDSIFLLYMKVQEVRVFSFFLSQGLGSYLLHML